MKRIIFTAAAVLCASSAQTFAECYFNTSRYWAVTSAFDFSEDISHRDFIAIEDENGRWVDGVVVNNEMFLFRDEHPVELVQKTENYCRMYVQAINGLQGYFFQHILNPEPEFFTNIEYIRFECGWAPVCAFKE